MINSIGIDRIKGTSSLYIDYLSNFDTIKEYYAADYRLLLNGEYSENIEKRERNIVAAKILEEQNKGWLHVAGYKKIMQQLKQKGTQAVVTGQQLGLLSGPLYTIYKALAAVKLADWLSSKMNNAVIPLFWLEGEDHDILEANKACLLDLKNTPITVGIKGFSSTNRIPVGELSIGGAVKDFFLKIEEMYPESEFKPGIMQMIKESYTPSSLWKSAFSRFLIKLLGKYGILLMDVSDKRWKKLTSPLFEKAISNAREMSEIVDENNKKLLRDGYHLQVTYNPLSTNLFLKVKGAKYLLESKKDGYFYLKGKKERISKDQLLEIAANEPERFIPNVLLRPVVQDYLLPTVSYVAGPAEITYYAQIKPLYDFFGVKMPCIFPRPSMTLVEKKIDKVAKKFNIDFAEFYTNPEKVLEQIIHEEVGDTIMDTFAEADRKLKEIINELKNVLLTLDSTLSSPLEKALIKMKHQLESLKQKSINAAKKAQQNKINQLEKLQNNLLPFGDMQERCLNITPFLIRYGMNLIDKIYDTIELDNFNHKLVYL